MTRIHGTGTVTRHRGKWIARLPAEHGRRSLGVYETKEEAADVVSAALAELVASPLEQLTLGEWGSRWMRARDVRTGTLARDVSRWNLYVLERPLGRMPLAEVRESHVEEWLQSLRGKAAQTRQNALGILRQALDAATRSGGPLAGKANPAERVKLKRRASDSTSEGWTWLRQWELEEALVLDVSFRSRAFWTVAAYSGLRAGELCGLRWDDVDFLRGVLRVRHSRGQPTKGGKPREVPLLRPALEALKAWQSLYDSARVYSPSRLVWPAKDGSFHADGYDAGWSKAVKGTSFEHARFHDLRHTCASHLLQGTWAPELIERPLRLEEVRNWLGHKDVQTTQRYAHLCSDAIGGLVKKSGTGLAPNLSRLGELNPGPTVYETDALAQLFPKKGRKRPDGASSGARLLRAARVYAEAVERGDIYKDMRGIELVEVVLEVVADASLLDAAAEVG